MSRPIRVAQVVGRMMGGGVEATVMNHYQHIDRSRVQFDFVAQTDSTVVPRREIESLGGHVCMVPSYENPVAYVSALERLFRQTRPDIVHSNMNAISVFTLCAAKQAGVPVRIAHSHSTSSPDERVKTVVKNMLRPLSRVYPTHLAACSYYAARWLFGEEVVDAGKVHVIHNALDLQRFVFDPSARARRRAELGVGETGLLVGQVGRLCFQKNQRKTLEMFAQLLRRRSDAVLALVGDGDDLGMLRQRARRLGVERSVRFMGVQDDIQSWYSAFDVLVLPSTYEGLSMAAIEAQAQGLPVVASNKVPCEADLVRGLVRHIPLQDDCRVWIESLLRLSEEYPVNTRTSHTRQLAAAGYDINQSAQQLADWYERIAVAQIRSNMTHMTTSVAS